jgi:small subunit ribosomal protein S8
MINDPLGDILTRIRNAQKTRALSLVSPSSHLRVSVLKVLEREGYISGHEIFEERRGVTSCRVFLKYYEGIPVIQEIARVSTPGRRVHKKIKDLGQVRNGLGIYVLSTSQGILSDGEARQANVGGEVLCRVC